MGNTDVISDMETKPVYEQVLDILKENGFHEDAAELADLIHTLLKDQSKSQSSAKEIEGLCHVKALGDLNIQTISYSEWGILLEKLSSYAKKKVFHKPHLTSSCCGLIITPPRRLSDKAFHSIK